MQPADHALESPEKVASRMDDGSGALSFAELEATSNQVAHLLRRERLASGDCLAILAGANTRYHVVCWGARRVGCYYTAISTRLTVEEVAYVLEDSGARLLFLDRAHADVGLEAAARVGVPVVASLDEAVGEVPSLDAALAGLPTVRVEGETEGADMLYSSGTTGRPKGVRTPLTGAPFGSPNALVLLCSGLYGMGTDTVYLSPAPAYHAAPLRFTLVAQALGGTTVLMERFEPERFLADIERWAVTHTQVVPTMLVRLSKLEEAVWQRYDLSSLRCIIHAAAPCPVPVKAAMIERFGPILHEYYAGTEGNGFVAIDSPTWLAHPGSVGKPLVGTVHVLDEAGREVGPGEEGTIFFEGGGEFSYHNDPVKTAASRNQLGWSTLGDIGYLDEEGFLYLTDRRAFMIISGGVNVYPQEAENVLVTHPKVADAAVFGVPNEDLGEEVKAVVEPIDWADAGPALAAELLAYCRNQLAHYKCPRTVDFERHLPRADTGKLYKRELRARYWPAGTPGAQ